MSQTENLHPGAAEQTGARISRPAANVAAWIESMSASRWHVLRYVILGVIALADVFLAVPAFDGTLRGATVLSYFCAIAFSLVTVFAAFTSGREAKLRRARLSLGAATAVTGAIVALFVLRIVAAQMNSAGLTYEGGAVEENAFAAELPVALVMALLMIATSILAWIDGYATTPSLEAMRIAIAGKAVATSGEDLAVREGDVTRLRGDRDLAIYQLDRIDPDLADALRALQALTRELQELARIEIVCTLKAPAATSGLDLPLPRIGRTPGDEDDTDGALVAA